MTRKELDDLWDKLWKEKIAERDVRLKAQRTCPACGHENKFLDKPTKL